MSTLLKISSIKRILLRLQSQASSLEIAEIEAVQEDFLFFKSLKNFDTILIVSNDAMHKLFSIYVLWSLWNSLDNDKWLLIYVHYFCFRNLIPVWVISSVMMMLNPQKKHPRQKLSRKRVQWIHRRIFMPLIRMWQKLNPGSYISDFCSDLI